MDHEFMLIEQYLYEELTPEQKRKVDVWKNSSHAKKIHDTVFGEGVERIVLPYDQETEIKINDDNYHTVPRIQRGKQPIHREIIRRLNQHGYHVDDYISGTTYHEDAPSRKLKISRVLSTIGIANNSSGFINKDYKQMTYAEAYAADPVRGAASIPKQIVITRNKYDVAGMSTGRGWRSCMNLEDGCNRHYVPRDITHGTLSAYVTRIGDDTVQKPIGRMNIKQFNHIMNSNDSTYKLEESVYGTIPPSFEDRVNDWVGKNYRPKTPGFYIKNRSLYDDDGVNHIAHEIQNIDFNQPYKIIEHHVNNAIDNYHDAFEIKNQELISPSTETKFAFEKLLSKKHRAFAMIEAIGNHSKDKKGTYYKRRDYLDTDTNATSAIRDYALNNIDSDFDAGVSEFNANETGKAIDHIHDSFSSDKNGDHDELKSIYGTLIDHVYHNKHNDNSFDGIRDNIAHHYLNNPNIYDATETFTVNDESKFLKENHPALLTKNPRLIHDIMDSYEDFTGDNPYTKDKLVKHAATYADSAMTHDILFDNEHAKYTNFNDSFLLHMHENNKHSESISHDLINHINNTNPLEYNDDHIETTKAIAKYTPHRSVFDRIKNMDISNRDEIHNAMRENIHFGHTIAPKPVTESHTNNIMQKYLRYL